VQKYKELLIANNTKDLSPTLAASLGSALLLKWKTVDHAALATPRYILIHA